MQDSGLGSEQDFSTRSRLLHTQEAKQFWAGAFDPDHPDTQRHYAMLASSDGLLDHLNPSSIVTIGDNLSRDAGYFKMRYPKAHCVATDLCVDGLGQAVDDGWVDSVMSVDVEHLPFDDNSIDCVIAKESFHHWPRPMLGFYEMLRVARKAVLLIEPNDVMHTPPTPLLTQETFVDDYEPVGNYKYQISLREILKAAWSLYLPAVACVGFNDPYEPERSFDQWLEEKRKLDEMGKQGQRQFNLMSIAIYRKDYEPASSDLPTQAYLYTRPRNPHLE